jgi:hypothetical protein
MGSWVGQWELLVWKGKLGTISARGTAINFMVMEYFCLVYSKQNVYLFQFSKCLVFKGN